MVATAEGSGGEKRGKMRGGMRGRGGEGGEEGLGWVAMMGDEGGE